jgi:hypothetical protein
MGVPNTTTFTLANVCDDLGLIGVTRNLVQCFSSAASGSFDPAYSGAKNNLLNFRNYGNVVATTQIFVGQNSTQAGACGAIPQTFYKLASQTGGFNTITKLFTDSGGTINASADWYSDLTFVRFYNGTSFTLNNLCS